MTILGAGNGENACGCLTAFWLSSPSSRLTRSFFRLSMGSVHLQCSRTKFNCSFAIFRPRYPHPHVGRNCNQELSFRHKLGHETIGNHWKTTGDDRISLGLTAGVRVAGAVWWVCDWVGWGVLGGAFGGWAAGVRGVARWVASHPLGIVKCSSKARAQCPKVSNIRHNQRPYV